MVRQIDGLIADYNHLSDDVFVSIMLVSGNFCLTIAHNTKYIITHVTFCAGVKIQGTFKVLRTPATYTGSATGTTV